VSGSGVNVHLFRASFSFEADVIILFHSTTIHTNYQPVIQCMTMRQSARITHIFDRELLRTGDRARVRFRFLYRSEFLKEGKRQCSGDRN